MPQLIIILAGFAVFASAISANKLALFTMSPTLYVAMRMLCAGFILLAFQAWRSPRLRLCHLKKDLFPLILISAITTFIPSVLKSFAMKNMISSKATLIGSLDPFVTAIYAYFLWGETLTRRKFAGMLIAFFGIFILLLGSSPAEDLLGGFSYFSYPELAALASMIVSRYGWILAQRILKNERYTPSELNALIMVAGGTLALILAYLTGTCDFCTVPFTLNFGLIFAYSVIVGNIIGYGIYSTFLKKYPITLTSLCGISVPLFVHLYGPIVVGEPLSPLFFVALGLVFAGTYIFMRKPAVTTAASH